MYWLLLSLERISAVVKLRGLVVALIAIALAAILSHVAQLHAINWLLGNAISFSAIILAIVFQPEVRETYDFELFYAQRNPTVSRFRLRTDLVLASGSPVSMTAAFD